MRSVLRGAPTPGNGRSAAPPGRRSCGLVELDALLQRDYQLLLGVFLITSVMVVVFNLLTDLVLRLVDPRIELQR